MEIVDILAVLAEMMAYAILDNSAMSGEREKGFSWRTYLFIIVSSLYLELFNAFSFDSRLAILVHIFSFFYCLLEVRKLNRAIYATACGVVILTIMEMAFASPVVLIKSYISPNNMSLALFINVLILLTVLALHRHQRILDELEKIYNIFEQKRYVILLILCCFLVVPYEVKLRRTFEYYLFFRFLIFFITILGIIFLWRREIIKNIKQKYENEQLLLYSQAYDTILKSMRARQHEFDNHLSYIINMRIIYKDYDSLVKNQMAYAESLQESYKFRKLLSIKQPIISGFLYLKFVKYEEVDAEIYYSIEVEDVTIYIPIIELVEVLATLIDNAFQALDGLESRKFLLEVSENKEELVIRVSNTLAEEIKYSELLHFFDKGYSTKGEGHGMGLYNAKSIVQKYAGDISVRCYTKDGEHWIAIKCKIKRRRQK